MTLRESIPLSPGRVVKKSIGGAIGLIVIGGVLALFAGIFLFVEIADLPDALVNLRARLTGLSETP